MTPETKTKKLILLQLTQNHNCALFTNPVGNAWTGKPGRRIGNVMELHFAGRISFGLFEGSPDQVGWVPVTITEDMVGLTVAVFLGIEVKAPGKVGTATKEQKQFMARLQKDGAIADIVDTVEDAVALVEKVKIGGLKGSYSR